MGHKKLSNVAQAVITITKGGEICGDCRRMMGQYGLMMIGCSLDKQWGYVGGLWCLKCWLQTNDHMKNRKAVRQEMSVHDKLGIPKAKRFGDTKAGQQRWEYTHTDLVDKEVVVLSAESITTDFGDAYLCKVLVNGTEAVVLFGGVVLVKQIAANIRDIPFKALLVKRPNVRYYEFTDVPEEEGIEVN